LNNLSISQFSPASLVMFPSTTPTTILRRGAYTNIHLQQTSIRFSRTLLQACTRKCTLKYLKIRKIQKCILYIVENILNFKIMNVYVFPTETSSCPTDLPFRFLIRLQLIMNILLVSISFVHAVAKTYATACTDVLSKNHKPFLLSICFSVYYNDLTLEHKANQK
jgi:hypothetical protein